jgi:hypothetical protein
VKNKNLVLGKPFDLEEVERWFSNPVVRDMEEKSSRYLIYMDQLIAIAKDFPCKECFGSDKEGKLNVTPPWDSMGSSPKWEDCPSCGGTGREYVRK